MEYIKYINFFISKIILFSIITKKILKNNIYLMEEIKKLLLNEVKELYKNKHKKLI